MEFYSDNVSDIGSDTLNNTPLLIDLVLQNLTRYLNYDTIKTCNQVCSIWNDSFKQKFLQKSQIIMDLSDTKFLTDFETEFDRICKIKAVYFETFKASSPSDFTSPLLTKFLQQNLTQVSLGIENKTNFSFLELNPQNIQNLLRLVPNMKTLTLINAKYSPKGEQVCLASSIEAPKHNLLKLCIRSSHIPVENDFGLLAQHCDPFFLVDYLSHLILGMQKLEIQFSQNEGFNYTRVVQCSARKRFFSQLSEMTIENIVNDSHDCRLIMNDTAVYPHLKRLTLLHKKIYSENNNRIIRYPDLEQLEFYIDFLSSGILFEVPALTRLTLRFSEDARRLLSCAELDLGRKCPLLRELELHEIPDPPNNFKMILEHLSHPNVRKLKVFLQGVKYDYIFSEFPNLQILHANLCGMNLVAMLKILSQPSKLKELTVLEDNLTENLELAMESYFWKFLTSLEKLEIKSANPEEARSTNLVHRILEESSKTTKPTLQSLSLQGFKICSHQYNFVKHKLPFSLFVS